MTVAIEVARGKRGPEPVARLQATLGHALDARRVLAPELVADPSVRPDADPRMTCTTPALGFVPRTASPGAPIARSTCPSPSKSDGQRHLGGTPRPDVAAGTMEQGRQAPATPRIRAAR